MPKGLEAEDIDRGRKVAEALIQAVVGSWEEGGKNKEETVKENVKDEDRRWVGS